MIALSFFTGPLHAEDGLKKSETSALNWLKLVDEGKYGQSWDKGAFTFKLRIPKKVWVQLMDSTRKPLGSVQNRTLADQRESLNPEGLPEGDYMVVVFKTTFAKNQSGHELLTLVLESDNQWRVLTYQAK